MNTKNLVSTITLMIVVLMNPLTQASQKPEKQKPLPIIDMHVHCYGDERTFGVKDPYGKIGSANAERLFVETYERFEKYNIVKAVVSGPLETVDEWKSKDEDNRIIRGILMMGSDDHGMSAERLERMIKDNKIELFGEIAPFYSGTTLSDPEWQPYLRICEKYDIPVCVHTGAGPPAITYTWAPKSRLPLGDPYLIEEVLVRYPRLRIYIAHSGAEWHEHALRLMACYPQLYSDLGAGLWIEPLAQRYIKDFLRNAKHAGYLDRVMFGSDQMYWPHGIDMSIDYLNSLDFLTEKDKRDILYNNAVRFLRLKEK